MKEMLKFKLEKNYLLWILLSSIAGLLILGVFFNMRLGYLKKSIFRNRQLLEQASPGFSNQTLDNFRRELKNLKAKTLGLIDVFSPPGEWTKKDYDYSIYFVEELNNTNKFLQEKAKSKQISYSDLGFKDKLPSEADALPMLNQLYGIKEIVNTGLDYNINFNSISPLGIETQEKEKQIRLARARMQLSGPKQGLIEFVIQLQSITPQAAFESFLLKCEDSAVSLDLTLNHTVVDLEKKEIEGVIPSPNIRDDISATLESSVNTLRSNNPFTVPKELEASQTATGESPAPSREAKLTTRFYYKGKAVLKSKEVVVIEDALNQETIFLAKDERAGNFKLKDFSDEQIILENINNGQETVIKRQELVEEENQKEESK